MLKKQWLCAVGFVAACAPSFSANALIVRTIDSDNYAVGTNLTEVISDVRISRLSQGGYYGSPSGLSTYDPVRSDVYAGERDYGGTFGGISNFFEYEQCFQRDTLHYCSLGFSVIEFSFSSPTDFVQLNFSWWSDAPGILIYGVDDTLLASCYSLFGRPVIGPCDYWNGGSSSSYYETSLSLQLDSRSIGRVVAGTPAGAWAWVDSISYSVPEPGALALLGLGLAGLGLSRRRNAA